MSWPYVSIAVERSDCERVERFLRNHLGSAFFELKAEFDGVDEAQGVLRDVRGLGITVLDVKDEVDYTVRFLEEYGLKDSNPLWHELDSRAFTIDVSIHAYDVWVPLLEILGDEIARLISRELKVRTVLSVSNGEIPFGVYEYGKKVRDFYEQYKDLFAKRDWQPRESSPPPS